MGILSREKQPLQQLHLKKGVRVFSRVGLFSGDYGTINDCSTFTKYTSRYALIIRSVIGIRLIMHFLGCIGIDKF